MLFIGNLSAAVHGSLGGKSFFASCRACRYDVVGRMEMSEYVPSGSFAPENGKGSAEKATDFWEFDKTKGAWKMVHQKPRKRLYAPEGKDRPFKANEITSEAWRCCGFASVHRGNWQAHQRILQRSGAVSYTHLTLPTKLEV